MNKIIFIIFLACTIFMALPYAAFFRFYNAVKAGDAKTVSSLIYYAELKRSSKTLLENTIYEKLSQEPPHEQTRLLKINGELEKITAWYINEEMVKKLVADPRAREYLLSSMNFASRKLSNRVIKFTAKSSSGGFTLVFLRRGLAWRLAQISVDPNSKAAQGIVKLLTVGGIPDEYRCPDIPQPELFYKLQELLQSQRDIKPANEKKKI
ncbi:MAG: DUF2939 domain-containing protein [Elusimicrobiaceae bacterium]